MKKLLLSALAISALALNSNAQAVARALAPANLAGNKTFTWADNWGSTPNFNTPGVFVQDTLAIAEDGTIGTAPQGHPLSQEGCNAFTNPADIQGKIAVVHRGTCEFSKKAKNAQDAGAVAVIILNRDPEAVGMGAGTFGSQITIPVVMLTSVDGAAIKAEIANSVPVVFFLGNKAGLYTNDVATNSGVAQIAPFAGMSKVYQNVGFTPAIELYNLGSQNQPAVSVNAKITGPGAAVVYNETSTFAMNSGDTVYIQTGNPNSFPAFAPANPAEGDYTLTYEITLGANSDDDPVDNTLSSPFRITSNTISLARLDATNNPIVGTYPSNSGGIYDACMTLRMPAALPGNRGITSFKFYPEADTSVFDPTGSEILFKVFEWSDSSVIDNTTIIPAGDFAYYLTSKNDTRQLKTVSLGTNGIELAGGQLYLVCLETADGVNIAFGYDQLVDYSGNRAISGLPVSPVQVNTQGADTWFTAGWSGTSALGLALGIDQISGVEEINTLEASIFPNPATDKVTLRMNTTGKVNVVVTDVTGKVVSNSTSELVNGSLKLSTQALEAGMYIFNITTENGLSTAVNVVKK